MQRLVRSSINPLYLQISNRLRSEIYSGHLVSGDRIPSERELMEEYTISRNTAKSAIDELLRMGLVKRIQGKGTFVSESKLHYGLHNLNSFSEVIRLQGKIPLSRVLEFSSTIASPEIAKKLQVEEGSQVYKLDRLRLADEMPMMRGTSFLPSHLFPNLDLIDFSIESLFSVIENQYHYPIAYQEQIIRPLLSSPLDADIMRVEVGTPMIETEGITFLEDNIPVEVNRLIYRCDLYELSIISTRR